MKSSISYMWKVEVAIYVVILAIMAWSFIGLDAFEWVYTFTRTHEEWELDEWLSLIPALLLILAVYAFFRTRDLSHVIGQLEKSQNEVLNELQMKKDFMAIVSHEMRTPLNGVIGMLEAYKHERSEEEKVEMLDLANQEARRLSSQLDDIIAFARIDHERVEYEEELVDPLGLLSRVEHTLQARAKDKGLTLSAEPGPFLPSHVLSYAVPLHQILLNLAENALKFTNTGTIHLLCDLVVDEKDLRPRLQFQVRDTGRGIPADKLEAIFKPYYQLERATTRHSPGLGLGLSLVKRLVDRFDGAIEITSKEGEGTVATVSIPVHLPDDEQH